MHQKRTSSVPVVSFGTTCSIIAMAALLMGSCYAAPLIEEVNKVEKRNLILDLLGGLRPTTQAPVATEEDIASSGDIEAAPEMPQDALFNATLVDRVRLPAMNLLLPSILYNYIRIGSVMNRNSGTALNATFVDLQDGIFHAPMKGMYRVRFTVNLYIDYAPDNSIVGAALCLNDICDGTLNKIAVYSYMTANCGQQILQVVGNLQLEENDTIKFFIFKTSQLTLWLLKETSMFGQTI